MKHLETCSWGSLDLCKPTCKCECHWAGMPEATRRYLRKQTRTYKVGDSGITVEAGRGYTKVVNR